jgi:hypothetical protein
MRTFINLVVDVSSMLHIPERIAEVFAVSVIGLMMLIMIKIIEVTDMVLGLIVVIGYAVSMILMIIIGSREKKK